MVNWSDSDLRAYEAKTRRVPSSAKPEPAVCNDALGSSPGEVENSGRVIVRVQSMRQRLLDPDNLCPKWFIDGLRYAGAIPGDRPDQIELHVSQVKVKTKSEERTEIELISNE